MNHSPTLENLPRNYHPASYRMRSFHNLRESFLDGTDSPRDYLERCLECIESREPVVKAWVTLNQENARQAADESGN